MHDKQMPHNFATGVHEISLRNGLRVVFAPTRYDSVVGVGVYYRAGIRSERPGQSGFAHLMEHLMFQGSQQVPGASHAQVIQSNGGMFNASTHLDYVEYFQVVPTHALERALFLEADRMKGPIITAGGVASQITIVRDEITENFINRPYGGFPIIPLRQLLYDGFANSHDGYTTLADLDGAQPCQLDDFFSEHYAPSNAALVIAGAFDADRARDVVVKLFDHTPANRNGARRTPSEPERGANRQATVSAKHVPVPAVAVGYPIGDPIGDFDGYIALIVLTKILAANSNSRLNARLIGSTSLAIDVRCYIAERTQPFSDCAPTLFTVEVRHTSGTSVYEILGLIDAELDALVLDGIGNEELDRATKGLMANYFRGIDSTRGRILQFGLCSLLHQDVSRSWQFIARLRSLKTQDVQAAAQQLCSTARGIVILKQETS